MHLCCQLHPLHCSWYAPCTYQSSCPHISSVEISGFSPPRLCLACCFYQISVSLKSHSSSQKPPQLSWPSWAEHSSSCLGPFGPGGVTAPLTPFCLKWFCQHMTARQGVPPANLSLLHVSSPAWPPCVVWGLRTPFAEGRRWVHETEFP